MSLRRSKRKRPPTGSWRSRAAAPFLKIMAFFWRRLLVRTTFIAVTGSLGKTTTKDCLAALLSSLGRTAKSYRNLNAGAGVSFFKPCRRGPRRSSTYNGLKNDTMARRPISVDAAPAANTAL